MKTLRAMFLLAGAMLILAGCATSNPNRQSDLPWNAPEPWESAPGIPGLEAR